ncbi:hypothetical protein DOTSEDRAFT_70747 [Dothistroma septosporum NZE10]|uniref:Uncharacterized protein n=1 Tax=Dothistroma septosporum (strain NZE10 / CBS 128990) TaxID=675120 RepID=N1PWV8_DOTSN|nr:hypothetical protein DOTSEDRAFT_70747 [Dothistroma septosporum NZE10]
MDDLAVAEARTAAIVALWRAWSQHRDLATSVALAYLRRAQQGPPGNEHERLLVDWDNGNLEQHERARLDQLLRELAAAMTGRSIGQMGAWQPPF